MFNHHRGLWGYTGEAADGALLSVQASGMGGPSTAVVVEELIRLGAHRIVRVGTCGALDDSLALGDLVVAGEALAEDGTSRALGAGPKALADPELAARLGGLVGSAAGAIASTDLFYAADPEAEDEMRARWRGAGARAVEMEAATLFTVAALRGARAAAVLAVSDLLGAGDERRRIADEALETASRRLGQVAAAALED
jgi:uridine phosphorylase